MGPYETFCKAVSLQDGIEYYFSAIAENKVGLSEPCVSPKPVIPKKGPSKFQSVRIHLYLYLYFIYNLFREIFKVLIKVLISSNILI